MKRLRRWLFNGVAMLSLLVCTSMLFLILKPPSRAFTSKYLIISPIRGTLSIQIDQSDILYFEIKNVFYGTSIILFIWLIFYNDSRKRMKLLALPTNGGHSKRTA
jgi:hypothetical protein